MSWTVDATGPMPAITSPTGTTGPTGNVTFSRSTETKQRDVQHRRLARRRRLHGRGRELQLRTFGLTSAVHTVNATDAYGKSKTTSWTWTVDATGPRTLAITSPTSGSTTGTSGSVTHERQHGDGDDLRDHAGHVYDRRHRAELTFSYAGLSGVAHTVTLTATDAYGNTTTAGPVSWTVDATLSDAGDHITDRDDRPGNRQRDLHVHRDRQQRDVQHRRLQHAAACTGAERANYSFSTFKGSPRPSTPVNNVSATDAYGNRPQDDVMDLVRRRYRSHSADHVAEIGKHDGHVRQRDLHERQHGDGDDLRDHAGHVHGRRHRAKLHLQLRRPVRRLSAHTRSIC